jgi:type IV secretion system protein VirB6
MIAPCAPSTAAPALARDILAGTDCLIAGRIEAAYAQLLAPGGVFVGALTAALTIYVAIIGYRLLLGSAGLSLRELVPHFVKIGLVLALATNWSGYQRLVFDLLFNGPEQLANAITAQLSDSPATGQLDVLAALQAVFDRITDYAGAAWAQVAPGTAPAATVPTAPPGAPVPAPVPGAPVAPRAVPGLAALPFQFGAAQFVAAALWLAALVMMAASVGVLLVARIILALLLALGPIFIALALFSATRGLFEGWLRTTVKFAAVPLFTLPLTAALVAVLLPFVNDLDDAAIASFRDGPTFPILLVVLVFAAVLFQAVRLAGGIAGGIRLPRAAPPAATAAPVTQMGGFAATTTALPATQGRAETLVQTLASGGSGRDSRSGTVPAEMLMATRSIGSLAPPAAPAVETGARLGQSYRRLTIAANNAVPPTRPAGA